MDTQIGGITFAVSGFRLRSTRGFVVSARMLTTRSFHSGDEAAIVELWRRCGLIRPQNDALKDIARKSKVRGELLRVGLLDGRIVATVMVGYEGHRGWINYLAVSPDHQRKGFGRQMIAEAEALLRAEGCPKINLQVRTSNVAVLSFYRALGYAVDDVVSLGKRLEHDDQSPIPSMARPSQRDPGAP